MNFNTLSYQYEDTLPVADAYAQMMNPCGILKQCRFPLRPAELALGGITHLRLSKLLSTIVKGRIPSAVIILRMRADET